jgi:ssDNA-specific exonuclease RecJ
MKQNFSVSYDKDFKKLEDFIAYVDNADDESDLLSYATQIKSLESIFKELECGSNISWEALVELQKCRELYKFSVKHPDTDFNNYVEELDDDSNLTSDTLGDMNKVAFYFGNMTN